MPDNLYDLSVIELGQKLSSREISARELVQQYIERIRVQNHALNAFISIGEDESLSAADHIDERRLAGEDLHPLAGIPIAVKDSIPTAGMRTTANSRLLENWVPKTDAAPIRRLRSAGTIILGKTNLNEFGWALPSQSDLVPPVRNPWNIEYASIGSSSGSGAAVAAGLSAAAVGTDGGGSARLPAGQHGLAGMKATHRRVSRLGMDDSSISEISPIARTTADTALLLSTMAGFEVDDWQSWSAPCPEYVDFLEADVRGWRIGVPSRDIEDLSMEPEVTDAFARGLSVLERLGVELVDIRVPGLTEARSANFIVLNAEAYTAHAKTLHSHPGLYGHSAYVYHWMGAFLSASDYLNARQIGNHVRQNVQSMFGDLRAIVTPTSPVVTAEAARQPGSHRKGVNAAFTAPFNLTGHPAISVPLGISPSTRLPIGLQFVGALFDEMTLFQLGHAFECANPEWDQKFPS